MAIKSFKVCFAEEYLVNLDLRLLEVGSKNKNNGGAEIKNIYKRL